MHEYTIPLMSTHTYTCTTHIQGVNVNLVQDLPITKPYTPREIDRLVQSKEVPTLCPFYIDMQPSTVTLQAMVERMKSISDTLVFATCKVGGKKGYIVPWQE